MARIPRLYRVRSVHRDGKVELRHYQGPEAAEDRRVSFVERDPEAVVTVTPSHPVTYPHAAGDGAMFEIPDAVISSADAAGIASVLGVQLDAIVAVHFDSEVLTVEYDEPGPRKGRRAPKLWRVYVESE